jgi:ATP-dependent Lhr-like helicase
MLQLISYVSLCCQNCIAVSGCREQALEAIRAVRRKPDEGETIIVSAADPLNLVGILLPGPRLSPFSDKVVAYRAGIPVAIDVLGAVLSHLQPATSQG